MASVYWNTYIFVPLAALKVWKKDYDRVIALAKGAYNSTTVQEIQAESLFFLARVYHVRDDLEHAHQFYDRACKLSPNLTPARFGVAQTLIAQEEYEEAATHLHQVLGTSNTATDALATLGLLEVRGGKKIQEGLAHVRKAIDLDPLNPDLILLEALALQQHESNFLRSLDKYKRAAHLMERQGKKIPFEIYTNIGVLCHETKNYEESLQMYRRAFVAADDSETRSLATLSNLGIAGGQIRHPDNSMFFGYVDTEFMVSYENTEEGTSSFTITSSEGKDVAGIGLVVGDHVKIGDSFESQIINIGEDGTKIELKDMLRKEEVPQVDEDGEAVDTPAADDEPIKTASLFVKRENTRLDQSPAISIAFNLARLHEVVGRTMAAVELHKAILKRNPAYVNSYLRLACIAIDCGALKECAGWLKIAAETAPGNPEVLTLIGNLHLSLCDWAPAQQVFDGLLTKKVQKVEAYAMLSLGNIYFANLSLPGKYAKHIGYAADFYKRILQKDTANAYAANGLGTVLSEKGELLRAKEVFNRVREVSGDAIADAHLNLGHVYLAQKRHPEALQMYQSYLKRTEDGSAPITSKSRTDDKVEVLMYIAFAYFDWARQTELFNNVKAAPADERYKKAMEHLDLALQENSSESKRVLLTYNLCMTKLQAANCVLQKLTRNIRRTAAEVEESLIGLQNSYETVEAILSKKNEGLKVNIATSMLNDFLTHCKSNIESARSHLEDERKREEEAKELRELQQLTAESQRKKQEMEDQLKKEQEARMAEERDRRVSECLDVFEETRRTKFFLTKEAISRELFFQAHEKMDRVDNLRSAWAQDQAALKTAAEKRSKKTKGAPNADDAFIDDDVDEGQGEAPSASKLFEGSDDEKDNRNNKKKNSSKKGDKDADASEDEGEDAPAATAAEEGPVPTQEDLFGDSDDDEEEEENSDEELVPSKGKRSHDGGSGSTNDKQQQATKKRKVVEEEDED